VLAVCCHIKNEIYLRKRANLALIRSQILQVEAIINAGRKINKRRHGKRNIKHYANQVVGIIFNLYNKEKNKRKIRLIVVYNFETSEENNSNQELYKSLTKQITRKRKKKDNHSGNKVKKTK
jgi:predicted RND superfamily exporter protein